MKSRTKADSPIVNAAIVEVAVATDVRRLVYAVAGGNEATNNHTSCYLPYSCRLPATSAVVGKLRFAGSVIGNSALSCTNNHTAVLSSIGVGEEKYFIGRIVTGGSAPCARVVNIRLYYPAAFARGEGLVVEGITLLGSSPSHLAHRGDGAAYFFPLRNLRICDSLHHAGPRMDY